MDVGAHFCRNRFCRNRRSRTQTSRGSVSTLKLRLHNSIFHFPVMLYRVRVSISETHVYCCVCSCDMQSKYSVFCHFRHHHQNVQQRWGHRLWVSLNFKNLKPQTKCCIHPSALISTACRAAVTTIVWTPGSPEGDGGCVCLWCVFILYNRTAGPCSTCAGAATAASGCSRTPHWRQATMSGGPGRKQPGSGPTEAPARG